MRTAAVVAATFCSVVAVTGQSAEPRFDVASVKPNRLGPTSPQSVDVASDHLRVRNGTTRTLLLLAYPGLDIEGAPDWVGRTNTPLGDRFDVDARVTPPAARPAVEAMLRAFLGDRFQLKVHTEVRTQKGLALVVADRDRKLGPSLKPTADDCATLSARAEQTSAQDPCGLGSASTATVTGEMSVRGLTLDQLAGFIARDVRARVVNRTELQGSFDWTLKWTPQTLARPDLDRNRFPTIDPNGPTISTALQEQLGLKLTPSEESANVLVIDHIERPTEN
jgi:uncharacterized protein (TIGR03435 family)